MPTSYTVLDSGVLLATVQVESLTTYATALVNHLAEQGSEIVAPALLQYELIAVIRKWVYRELTTPQQAETALNTLLRYPVFTVVDNTLLRRAYELAAVYNRPTAYDAQYLAVAERFQCDFWTADERLYNAVKDEFPRIYWLGNFESAS